MSSRGILPALVVLLMAACGDDTLGPPGGVAGNWAVSYTDDGTDCGDGITMGTVDLVILQTGNVLVVTSDGIIFTGILSGSQGTWAGSYAEDGGTTTEAFTVTFTDNNTMFSGGSVWTWTDGLGGCAGTSTITGSR